jgi:hypothetical protein
MYGLLSFVIEVETRPGERQPMRRAIRDRRRERLRARVARSDFAATMVAMSVQACVLTDPHQQVVYAGDAIAGQ